MNMVENEFHFVLVCPTYRNLRNTVLPNYYCRWPSITKLKQLLCNSGRVTLQRIALAFESHLCDASVSCDSIRYPPPLLLERNKTLICLMLYIAIHVSLHSHKLLYVYEPPHDKSSKMTVRPGKTQISLGDLPV